jgi:hypothetical protein
MRWILFSRLQSTLVVVICLCCCLFASFCGIFCATHYGVHCVWLKHREHQTNAPTVATALIQIDLTSSDACGVVPPSSHSLPPALSPAPFRFDFLFCAESGSFTQQFFSFTTNQPCAFVTGDSFFIDEQLGAICKRNFNGRRNALLHGRLLVFSIFLPPSIFFAPLWLMPFPNFTCDFAVRMGG